MRRAISLLEVLISIFVLSIGLLALAALIPIGRYEIVEASKADRSAALARASLREIKIRRFLKLEQPDSGQGSALVEMWDVSGNPQFVFVDPLYLHRNCRAFPVIPSIYRNFPGGPVSMSRVDIRVAPIDGAPWMRFSEAAELVFLGQDDLVFDVPTDRDERPTAMMEKDVIPTRQMFQGHYSWAFMVAYPRDSQSVPLKDRRSATVFVVVFYKRDFSPAGQRVASVTDFPGAGFGGGDITMSLQDPEDVQLARKGRWILLLGSNGGFPGSSLGAAAWYRVIACSPPQGNACYLTLAGPDWDVHANPTATAVLLDSIAAVFTETIEIDTRLQ